MIIATLLFFFDARGCELTAQKVNMGAHLKKGKTLSIKPVSMKGVEERVSPNLAFHLKALRDFPPACCSVRRPTPQPNIQQASIWAV